MITIAKMGMLDGDLTLLDNFPNAINARKRNLLVKLVSTFLPEETTVAHWSYAEESELHIFRTEAIIFQMRTTGLWVDEFIFCLAKEVCLKTYPSEVY